MLPDHSSYHRPQNSSCRTCFGIPSVNTLTHEILKQVQDDEEGKHAAAIISSCRRRQIRHAKLTTSSCWTRFSISCAQANMTERSGVIIGGDVGLVAAC